MATSSVGSTSPDLLRRVAALSDNPAWGEFLTRYDNFIRARCSVYGLDPASVDELCQRVWVELTRRMPSYQYDPSGSFRGWLRRLCHHRAIDLLRERNDAKLDTLDERELIDVPGMARDFGSERELEEREDVSEKLQLLREAAAIQEEVKRKVKPARWEAFWRVVIEDQSVGEAAGAMGLKYATGYAGVNHVAELLCAEGRRGHPRLKLDD